MGQILKRTLAGLNQRDGKLPACERLSGNDVGAVERIGKLAQKRRCLRSFLQRQQRDILDAQHAALGLWIEAA